MESIIVADLLLLLQAGALGVAEAEVAPEVREAFGLCEGIPVGVRG